MFALRWRLFYNLKRRKRQRVPPRQLGHYVPIPPLVPPPQPGLDDPVPPVPIPPPLPGPNLHMPHIMPEFPHQQLCSQICNSVVRLAYALPNETVSYLPAIIVGIERGSYCLLFDDCSPSNFKSPSFRLRFPYIAQAVDVPSSSTTRSVVAIHDEDIRVNVLSYHTDIHHCQPIRFGKNVTRFQKVILFDFRYGNPSVDEGDVVYADTMHFLLDAKLHHRFVYGSLIFDLDAKLVGMVYCHDGSPLAIQINYLATLLSDLLPVPTTETLDAYFQNLEEQ